MSNTIRISDYGSTSRRFAAGALCAVLLTGCGNGQASEPAGIAETQSDQQTTANEDNQLPTGGAPALPSRDADEISQTSRVISMEEMPRKFPERSGEAGCFITFAYAGHAPETLIWSGEPCTALTAQFMTPDELRAYNDWDRLDGDIQNKVRELPGQKVLYVGGEFTASVYPLDYNNLTIEVVVSD